MITAWLRHRTFSSYNNFYFLLLYFINACVTSIYGLYTRSALHPQHTFCIYMLPFQHLNWGWFFFFFYFWYLYLFVCAYLCVQVIKGFLFMLNWALMSPFREVFFLYSFAYLHIHIYHLYLVGTLKLLSLCIIRILRICLDGENRKYKSNFSKTIYHDYLLLLIGFSEWSLVWGILPT